MKNLFYHIARNSARRLDVFGPIIVVFLTAFLVLSCGDERTEPPMAPDPGFTRTFVLVEDAVTNGQDVTMSFSVDDELAPILQPGVDQPARLFLTAYIRPDADIEWREAIIDDSIPAWEDPVLVYQIEMEALGASIENLTALIESCEANPECDTLQELQDALSGEESLLAAYQDSIDIASTDTIRLGLIRDSLAVVVDDRYRLAVKFDDDPFVAYPDAVFMDEEMSLGGQEIYLAQTDSDNIKGKTFTLNLSQFDAADADNIGRPIEVNWTTCFIGVDRPCLAPGEHSFTVRVTGAETKITAVLVLVYAEEI